MDEIVQYSGALSGSLHLIRTLISYTTAGGRILQGSFFIPIGILIAQNPLRLKESILFFTVSFCANYFIDHSAISSMLLFLSSIGFLASFSMLTLKTISAILF